MGASPDSAEGPRNNKPHTFKTTAWVLLIAFAVLFGDHIIGWIYYKTLCLDAGVAIHRVVDDVPGLRWSMADRDTPRRHGYQFIEIETVQGGVTRYVVDAGGVREDTNVIPMSRYSSGHRPEEAMGLHVIRHDYVVADDHTAEELAVYRTVTFRGGWLLRLVLGGFGSVAVSCPTGPFSHSGFVTSVLRPAKRN
jgi:hypothetical protein